MKVGEIYYNKDYSIYRKIVSIYGCRIYSLCYDSEINSFSIDDSPTNFFNKLEKIDKIPSRYEEKELTLWVDLEVIKSLENIKKEGSSYCHKGWICPRNDTVNKYPFTGTIRQEVNFNWDNGTWELI